MVLEIDRVKNSKLKSWAYNADAIAFMTDQCRATVLRHIAKKRFKPESLESVTAYIEEIRGAVIARHERKCKRSV